MTTANNTMYQQNIHFDENGDDSDILLAELNGTDIPHQHHHSQQQQQHDDGFVSNYGFDSAATPYYSGLEPSLYSSPPPPPCPLALSPEDLQSSAEATCHQLVKESLKMTIQQKRQQQGLLVNPASTGTCGGGDHQLLPKEEVGVDDGGAAGYWPCYGTMHGSPPLLDDCNSSSIYSSECPALTPEDEERRRRRRERNKIAATKCRNKKKENTHILVQDWETLEADNGYLRDEIHKLQAEMQRLQDLLEQHSHVCKLNNGHSCDTRNTTAQVLRIG